MLDALDRQILNRLQTAFPVTAEPFRTLSDEMGLAEGDVLKRVQALKKQGLIRRIGAVFNLDRLGFVSTLCAAKVPEDKVDLFVETVNALPGVTHHYRRNHPWNYWFTLICPSPEALVKTLAIIEEKTDIEIIHMRANETFKINASFQL
jgi:siroheme decarboxylase